MTADKRGQDNPRHRPVLPSPNVGRGAGGEGRRPPARGEAPLRRDTDTGRIRGTTRDLDDAARLLRRRQTEAEERLWQALRGRRAAGLKFRRQHPLGPYVVDFCCPAAMLIVELDGAVHRQRDQQDYDAARTERLEQFGYRVLRFDNDQVLQHLAMVVDRITTAANYRVASPSATSEEKANATPGTTPPPPTLGEGAGG